MKGSIFAIVAVTVGMVSAQFPGVPACAGPCLIAAISSVGCALTDIGCQCGKTGAIQGAGAGCILAACTAPGELQSAITGGGAICVNYLATVSASGTGSSAEATTTIRSTTTATSTIVVQTSDIPSPASTGSTTGSVTSAPITSATSSPSRSVSSAASSTVSQVASGAADKKNVVGLGGVGAVVMALLAL